MDRDTFIITVFSLVTFGASLKKAKLLKIKENTFCVEKDFQQIPVNFSEFAKNHFSRIAKFFIFNSTN